MPKQPAIPILGRPVKFTMLMKTPTKRITEVHWYTGAASLLDAQLNTDAAALANLRAACIPNDCIMIKWNLSQENVFGDSVEDPGAAFDIGITGENENQGNDCLPIFMSGTTQYRRTLYLACVPDSAILDDKYAPEVSLDFAAALNLYMGVLTGKNPGAPPGTPPPAPNTKWGFLPRLATSVTYPLAPIATNGFAFTSLLNKFTITTDVNHGASVGDVVQISKVQGVNAQFPLNQLWIVAAVPAVNQLTLQGFPPSVIPNPVPVSGGFVQKRVKGFQLYDGYAIGQPSSHNRGNSAGAVKGRKKKKYNIGWPG